VSALENGERIRTQELVGLPAGAVWRSREEWESQITHYPGDLERLEAALAAHFAGQTPRYETEVRIVLASGEIRCLLHRGTVALATSLARLLDIA
jgi:hypothetical protein